PPLAASLIVAGNIGLAVAVVVSHQGELPGDRGGPGVPQGGAVERRATGGHDPPLAAFLVEASDVSLAVAVIVPHQCVLPGDPTDGPGGPYAERVGGAVGEADPPLPRVFVERGDVLEAVPVEIAREGVLPVARVR